MLNCYRCFFIVAKTPVADIAFVSGVLVLVSNGLQKSDKKYLTTTIQCDILGVQTEKEVRICRFLST